MGTSNPKPQRAAIIDSDGHELLIDCMISDTHEYESDVTEYPVESGSNIVDNIRPKPITVTIDAVISNDPVGEMIAARDGVDNPVADALTFLEKMFATRLPGKVRTSLRTYDQMAMKSLSISRNAEFNAESLKFSAAFLQMRVITNTRSVRVSIPIAQGGSKKDAPATPAPFFDYRTIDRKTLQWFDPAVGRWRQLAVYDKSLKKWRLYAGTEETIEVTSTQGNGDLADAEQAFDSLRFDGKHPTRNTLSLTPNEYVLVGPKGEFISHPRDVESAVPPTKD